VGRAAQAVLLLIRILPNSKSSWCRLKLLVTLLRLLKPLLRPLKLPLKPLLVM
jgi:hypothetical protein